MLQIDSKEGLLRPLDETFIRFWNSYDFKSHPIWKVTEIKLLRRFSLDGLVLDLCCGDGIFTTTVYADKVSVGADLNFGELRKAQKMDGHKALVATDARMLAFRESTFDRVFSICAVEHIPNTVSVLPEIYRVLKPGGLYFFTTPSENFIRLRLAARLFHWTPFYDRYLKWKASKYVEKMPDPVVSPREWEDRLRKVGFEIKKCSYYMGPRAMRLWSGIGMVERIPKVNCLLKKLLPKVIYLQMLHSVDANGVEIGGGVVAVVQKPK